MENQGKPNKTKENHGKLRKTEENPNFLYFLNRSFRTMEAQHAGAGRDARVAL